MIAEEESHRIKVESVDDGTPQDNKRPLTAEEVEDNKKYYKKASLILDHLNKCSKTVSDYPGFSLSNDVMMKLY